MQITYKKQLDPRDVVPPLLSGITGKEEKTLSVKTWKRLLVAEHSPIRAVVYEIVMRNIPYYASVHLVRHKHGVEHFVQSQRIDDNRDQAPQGNPVTHTMYINAQALINMARVRLCHKADTTTQLAVSQIKMSLSKGDEFDRAIAQCMRPKCEWFGNYCPEFTPCGKRPHGVIKGKLIDKFF